MGWFDEQIRQRRETDDAVFEDSFRRIAGAVMGRRLSDAMNSDQQRTEDAIGEILKYYRIPAREVPETVTDMNEVLEFLLRPSGLMRRSVHLDKGWYRDTVGAMLGTRSDNGALVALIPTGLNGYSFQDHETGKRVRITRRTEHLIAREAVAFYKPFPLEKMTMGSLLRYILAQITLADGLMVGLSMLLVTLVGMLMPKLNQLLFSQVLDSGSGTVLLGMGIFMGCVTVSTVLLNTVQSLALERLQTKISLSVEAATMMRLLSLPAEFFKHYSAGELSSRAQVLNSLASQLLGVVTSTGLTSLFSILYVTEIFAFAPALVVPALLITLLTVTVTTLQVLGQMVISKRQMELGSRESGLSYQLISGIQKIRLAGAEKLAFSRWGNLYSKSARLLYNPPLLLKVGSVVTLGISLFGTMVLYDQAIRSGVSIADYYAFSAAYGMVSGAFLALSGIATTLGRIKPVYEVAKPLLETVPEVAGDKLVLTHISGGVELNNVTFRYREDMPPVLDDLSLKIRPGQYVAIVGKTGCGKSTLMRILLGFETPQKGAVYYDGRDLKTIDLKSLRQRIGAVMQNGKLFAGDIFSNITLSAPWLTLDDAWEAAELAGIADDIRAMPMGMNTLLSEGQGGISGGQRQRLLIARAVAPKPKILMFDEATSALDNLTQKQISEALDRMKCTRIVIAHRLSTIRQCDRIILLDQGKILEDGSYEELIAQDGAFAELVARQRLEDAPAAP